MSGRRAASARALLLSAALLTAGLVLTAASDAPEDPWDIISRSTTMQKAPGGKRIISFIDDVVITHGELTATSDRARYLEQQRRAILDGHVVMWQDSTIIRGPYTYYERETGVARFPHGVVVERASGTAVADQGIWRREENRFELRGDASAADTTGTLDAQAMTYDIAGEVFYAVGDARLVDDVTGVVVQGQNIKYDRAVGTAVVTGGPSTVFTDDDGYDIRVTSEQMTYNPVTKEATAERNVLIRRETMTATAGRADFFREEDRAVLTESPEMVDGATAIRGERIEMLNPGPGRRTVRVFGAAVVANRFLDDRERPVAAEEADDLVAAPPDDEADAGEGDGSGAADPAPGSPRTSREVLREDNDARVTLRKARTRVQEHIDLVKDAANAPAEADTAAAAGAPEAEFETELTGEVGAVQAAVDSAFTVADSLAVATEAAAEGAEADSAAAEGEPVPEWLRVPSDQLPTENLLFGDEITLYFVDNELDQVVVVGHGRSKFFPSEQNGVLTEWNDVVGDTLYVWFTESDLDSVHVSGNGEGEYRFPADGLEGASSDVLRSNGKLVDYKAPVIRYMRTQETMHLEGGATVLYKTMNLTSGKIDFEAAREIMTASGNPPPVLVDREDEIHGAAMNYHLPSGKGEIIQGRTQFEAGYYSGKDIWRLGDEELAVDHAIYTTCDHEDPHYHFSCRHMKIYLDDKMVARPVVLKIRDIPVFALPFYMTSLRKDRHSGFLLPNLELGVDDARGRFIRNMGYYWAPNDYMDVTGTVDFYPARDQFVGYLDTRYNVRYRYNGSVGLKYNRDASVDRKQTAVEIRHDQTISETARLTANASFLSSNSIYQEIDDSNRLDRDLSSHATFTKRFEGSRSLRVEARRNENLDNGSFTETLPSIVFTQPSQPITGRNRNDPVAPGEEAGTGWLDEVYYKTDLRAVAQRRRDTAGVVERNTGSTVDTRLNTTQNLFRYLRISPNLSGEATWIDKDELGDKNQLRATYNGALTARTDVYGTFLTKVGPVQGFRHVIRPSLSWNWAPEFREYFYVEEGDTTGTLRDRFTSFGGIRGTQRKTNRMSLALGNLIQTKVLRGERESRYDLFNFNTTMSYDFLAEDEGRKPLSNLNTSLTVLSASPVNQTWSVSHDPYTWNLLSSSVTTRAAVSSRSFGGGNGAVPGTAGPEPLPEGDAGAFENPVGGGRPGPTAGGRYPAGEWRATISHTARANPATGSNSSNLVLAGQWSPTPKWQLTFDYQYDLSEGINTTQTFSVRRMIHCWELSFDRRLLGGDWQYYLRINVTDLPDIQLERGDRTSGRGFGTSTLPAF